MQREEEVMHTVYAKTIRDHESTYGVLLNNKDMGVCRWIDTSVVCTWCCIV